MEHPSLSDRLLKLEKQTRQLVSKYQDLQKEKEKLTAENEGLQEKIQALSGELDHFKNQDKIAKIVSSTTVEREESTELKNKLNEYIKEIDRCIAHLSE